MQFDNLWGKTYSMWEKLLLMISQSNDQALELLEEVVNHTVIEILSTQMNVSASGLDFKDPILNSHDTDIEDFTTQVSNQSQEEHSTTSTWCPW